MALKKRTVVSPAAGAVSLPSLMADLPGTRRLEEVPLDKLSPAPADWNFYAPLPDDKLLELIESIRANDLLHPIVVWKQPDGALMILSGHNRVRAYTALLEKTGEDKYRRHRTDGHHRRRGARDRRRFQLRAARADAVGEGAEHLPEVRAGRAQKAQQERRAQIKV